MFSTKKHIIQINVNANKFFNFYKYDNYTVSKTGIHLFFKPQTEMIILKRKPEIYG